LSVPCLVLSFEHDVDSPPARAREAAERIPGARFVEIAGASHLGVFTHAEMVADQVVGFFAEASPA
jgi:pimeloyl-ACP methyl ester carboxylesterase